MSFAGFGPEAFAWFTGIEANNNREWFTANREVYDNDVRGQLEAMLEELCDELGGGRVKVFRQNRDIRFSADKSPYKTRTYGLIGDRPGHLAGLYLEVSTPGLFAGTGYHQMESDQLARFRDAIVDDTSGAALQQAIDAVHAAGVETWGEALKTAPRGYPRDHPRAVLLRHKSLVAGGRLVPRRGRIARDAALDHARSVWAACAPLTAWLDAQVGESRLAAGTAGRRR